MIDYLKIETEAQLGEAIDAVACIDQRVEFAIGTETWGIILAAGGQRGQMSRYTGGRGAIAMGGDSDWGDWYHDADHGDYLMTDAGLAYNQDGDNIDALSRYVGRAGQRPDPAESGVWGVKSRWTTEGRASKMTTKTTGLIGMDYRGRVIAGRGLPALNAQFNAALGGACRRVLVSGPGSPRVYAALYTAKNTRPVLRVGRRVWGDPHVDETMDASEIRALLA